MNTASRLVFSAILLLIAFLIVIISAQPIKEPPVPIYIYNQSDKIEKLYEDTLSMQKKTIQAKNIENDSLKAEIKRINNEYSNCLTLNYVLAIALICMIIIFTAILIHSKKKRTK